MTDDLVIHTADGRRIEQACPICQVSKWGELWPPGHDPGVPVVAILLAMVGETMDVPAVNIGLEVQRLVCLNCGFVMHRTSGVLDNPVA